jgi:PIN domain nuclease of toxin-antitoxin system
MRLILDTNVFLRLTFEPELVADAVRSEMDGADARYLSVASAWEIAIKTSTGKLRLDVGVAQFVQEWSSRLRLQLLPIEFAHLERLQKLPMHHRDPFDRLIVAQALAEGLTLATADRRLSSYGVAAL